MRNHSTTLLVFFVTTLLSACSYPFEHFETHDLELQIGEVGSSCDQGGIMEAHSGVVMWQASVIDESVIYDDEAPRCQIEFTWADGYLIDMPEIRRSMRRGSQESGIDPDSVSLTFNHVRIDPLYARVNHRNGSALQLPGVAAWATVSMPAGGPTLMTMTMIPPLPDDPDEHYPQEIVDPVVEGYEETLPGDNVPYDPDQYPLLGALNEAYTWNTNAYVIATGAIEVPLDDLELYEAATRGIFEFTYQTTIEGDVYLW